MGATTGKEDPVPNGDRAPGFFLKLHDGEEVISRPDKREASLIALSARHRIDLGGVVAESLKPGPFDGISIASGLDLVFKFDGHHGLHQIHIEAARPAY